MPNKEYQFITEELYDQIITHPQDRTVARISFYKELQQDGFEGILYVEVDRIKTLEEVKKVLERIRSTSYPGSLSFKQEINLPGDEEITEENPS
jgi:uncharacterized protein with ACT and thioredoxin-like domain